MSDTLEFLKYGDYDYTEKEEYKDADTVIADGQGWTHYAYRIRFGECTGCPYLMDDINGNAACYGEMYKACESGEMYE